MHFIKETTDWASGQVTNEAQNNPKLYLTLPANTMIPTFDSPSILGC